MKEITTITPPENLNERQKRFAELVAGGASQTQAYIAAGYSPHLAHKHAARLAANGGVKAYIKALSEAASQNRALSLQETLDFLSDVVRTPISEIDETSYLCQEKRIAADGTVTLKMPSKLEAAKLSAMLRGYLKREGGGVGQVNVNVVNVKERTDEQINAFLEQKRRVMGDLA